jgi:hypothetical protein
MTDMASVRADQTAIRAAPVNKRLAVVPVVVATRPEATE